MPIMNPMAEVSARPAILGFLGKMCDKEFGPLVAASLNFVAEDTIPSVYSILSVVSGDTPGDREEAETECHEDAYLEEDFIESWRAR